MTSATVQPISSLDKIGKEPHTPRRLQQIGFVGVLLLLAANTLYGWSSAHVKITKAALDVLPDDEMAHWRQSEEGFRRYCVYPDMGLTNEEAKKYLVVVHGRLLHYFPRDNKVDYAIFNEGAQIYLNRIATEIAGERYDEAARYAGAFAHVLEDLSQPQCHSLEGINGFSWTVLDELFTPEDQTWNRAPQSVITLDDNAKFQVTIGDYKPRLLGTHPAEAAFCLYQRSCQIRRIARKALPPILTAIYAGNQDAAIEAGIHPAAEAAKLVADMFHTCFAMGREVFPADEETELDTMDLTDLVPITAPSLISIPYRFSPLAYGSSVTMDRKPVPLLLRLPQPDGNVENVVFEKGIGTGCCTFSYEIPAGVFKEFRCVAGLHATLGKHARGANLRMSVKFRGKEVFASGVLEADSQAVNVSIPVKQGGTLEFVSQGNPGLSGNEANHAVWANPVLVRLNAADRPTFTPLAPTDESNAGPADAPRDLGPNLLQNASLEEWGEDGLPLHWKAYLRKESGCHIDPETTDAHEGKSAARLTVDENGSIVALWTTFKNEPGKRYLLTINWKSPRGVLQYAIKKSQPKLGWIAFNGHDWQLKNANPIATGSMDAWNCTTIEFPAADKEIELNIELCRPHGKGASYSFLLDDLRVQEIKQ